MKKHILTFITFFLVIGYVNGQNTLTVNNNSGFVGNGTTTFTDLQQAVDAASAGDIIYIAGSPISYGDVNINKQLQIIGAGAHQDIESGIDKESIIANINLYTGCDNSIFRNLRVTTNLQGNEDINTAISNITIENCYVYMIIVRYYDTSVLPENWIIRNNIVTKLMGTAQGTNYYMGRIQIVNNIINHQLMHFNSSDMIVAYNLFTNVMSNYDSFSRIENVTLTSNIFYVRSASACSGCTFYNNLLIHPDGQTSINFNSTDNLVDASNLENVDPLFTNIVSENFSWDNDYHLSPGSPALTAGPGSTEIGIYSAEGIPFSLSNQLMPVIKELKIETPLIEQGEQLQIKIKAEN